jgi:hypothetical protein
MVHTFRTFLWVGLSALFLISAPVVLSVTMQMAQTEKGTAQRVFITDRTGERWDVPQARSLGFRPERFQYGIGKHAFTPLADSGLIDGPAGFPLNRRVIGVTDGVRAQAYSVDRLRYHEIANSMLGDKPIVVGC